MQNSLAPLNWTSHYLPRYGAIFDFVRSHPDVFHTAPDNAFYQPEASLSDLSSEASSISYPHLQRLASAWPFVYLQCAPYIAACHV